jgi:hypothetical protein
MSPNIILETQSYRNNNSNTNKTKQWAECKQAGRHTISFSENNDHMVG